MKKTTDFIKIIPVFLAMLFFLPTPSAEAGCCQAAKLKALSRYLAKRKKQKKEQRKEKEKSHKILTDRNRKTDKEWDKLMERLRKEREQREANGRLEESSDFKEYTK